MKNQLITGSLLPAVLPFWDFLEMSSARHGEYRNKKQYWVGFFHGALSIYLVFGAFKIFPIIF